MSARADRFLADHSWEQEREKYFSVLMALCPDEGKIAVRGGSAPARAERITAGSSA